MSKQSARRPRLQPDWGKYMNEQFYAKLLDDLSNRHGQVIGGETLSKVLGFSSIAAMKQALKRGTLSIPTFFIKGRRGRFALTTDVAT